MLIQKISKNGAGLVLLILSLIGLEVSEADVMEFVSAIGTIISFGLMIWNQWDRRDVSGFIFKR